MATSGVGKVFEAGVKAALEFFKNVDWKNLRQLLAESAQTVFEAAAKNKKP
jgi:hypothetical protein